MESQERQAHSTEQLLQVLFLDSFAQARNIQLSVIGITVGPLFLALGIRDEH